MTDTRWRCPECKERVVGPSELCAGVNSTGHSVVKPERVATVVPEEALTDEMVERAAWALIHDEDRDLRGDWPTPDDVQGYRNSARVALLAAGPWTRKPDRKKMIETVVPELYRHRVSMAHLAADRIVNALLEAM